jgi:hypothetical protein
VLAMTEENVKISCSLSEITGENIDQKANHEYISSIKKDENPVIIMGREESLPGLYFCEEVMPAYQSK